MLYWICLFFSAYQEGTLSLCLCDTNAQEDVHINDTLVAEEYAFCPKLDSAEAQSPNGQVYKYRLIYSGISTTVLLELVVGQHVICEHFLLITLFRFLSPSSHQKNHLMGLLREKQMWF